VSPPSTTRSAQSGVTTTADVTTTRAPTPGLPGVVRTSTPGINAVRLAALTANDSGSSSPVVKQVAIAVAVIVGGLVLIAAVVAAIVWAVTRTRDQRLVSPRNSSYEATLE